MGTKSGLKAIAVLALVGLSLTACGKKATSSSSASTVKLKSATTVKGSTATTAKGSTTTTTTTTTAKGSTATTKPGTATSAPSSPGVTGKGKVASSLATVPAPPTTLKHGSGPLSTLKPVTTVREASTIPPVTVAAGAAPAKPEDRNCSDFANWAEAKQFFDTYYPYYGDVARLDGDGDGIPCEALSGSPK